ncbi:MAG: PilZ domain-containing protein [Bacillota bacterium]
MTDRELLTAGSRLQLLNEIEQAYYAAQVKQVDEETFTIGEAYNGDKSLAPEKGSVFQITLYGQDAVYYFSARVMATYREEDDDCYVFSYPVQMHRHQRRSHARVPYHLHVNFWPLDKARQMLSQIIVSGDDIPLEDSRWGKGLIDDLHSRMPSIQGITLDLSGGGLRMVTLEPVRRQERLLIQICLDERGRQFFLLEGRITRTNLLAIGNWKRYRVGVAFINISRGMQERIIRHIFRIMRKRV